MEAVDIERQLQKKRKYLHSIGYCIAFYDINLMIILAILRQYTEHKFSSEVSSTIVGIVLTNFILSTSFICSVVKKLYRGFTARQLRGFFSGVFLINPLFRVHAILPDFYFCQIIR